MDSGVKKKRCKFRLEHLQRPADGLICNLLGSEITNISVTCDNQLVVEQLRELEGGTVTADVYSYRSVCLTSVLGSEEPLSVAIDEAEGW